MNAIVAVTGMLPAIVLVSAVLTAIVSVLLLRLFRRAVLRAMNASAGAASASEPPASAPTPAPRSGPPQLHPALAIIPVREDAPGTHAAEDASRASVLSLHRAAAAYAIAALVYALIMALPWLAGADGGLPLLRLLWLVACYAWPGVLSVLLLTSALARMRVFVPGAYFVLLASIAAAALLRNPELSVSELVYFWLFANVPATLLLAAFLRRSVRAVGPLVLAFMVAGVAGAFLSVTVAGSNDALLYAIVSAGSAVGLGAMPLFVLLHVLGFGVLGVVGWWLLGRIGRAYRAKRISDQSLTVDSLFVLFGIVQSISYVFEGWIWSITGLVAIAAYKAVAMLGFARLARASARSAPAQRSLLLLRVFDLGRRSEQLLDALSARWLRVGNIDLIAGPDLVTSTVKPDEFLAFLGGNLSRRFVESEAQLQQRLDGRDTGPDPDGRFRVNHFFCRRDTWQMTMQRLAARSGAVLMDLRAFSPRNQGCLWELEHLLGAVPLERIVLLVDRTTDRTFLEQQLQSLWAQIPHTSINRSLASPAVRLLDVPASIAQAAQLLVNSLFNAGIASAAPGSTAARQDPAAARCS